MVQELGKRANVLRWPVAVFGLWHRVGRLRDLVLHIAPKNGYRRRQRIRRRDRIGQVRRDLGVGQGRQDGNGYQRNHDASNGSEHVRILQDFRVQVACQDSGFLVSMHWPSKSAVTSSGCGTTNPVRAKTESVTYIFWTARKTNAPRGWQTDGR